MTSATVFAFERLCVLTFIPCSGSLWVGIQGTDSSLGRNFIRTVLWTTIISTGACVLDFFGIPFATF